MKQEEIFILAIGILAVLKYAIYDNFNLDLFIQESKSFIRIIGLISIIPLTIYFYDKYLKSVKEKQEIKNKIESEELAIKKILETSINLYDSEEIKKFIEKLKYFRLSSKYSDQINEKLLDAKRKLKERLHKEELYQIREEKKKEEIELQKVKKEIFEKQKKLGEKKEVILNRLNPEENLVFLTKSLNKKEIEVLQKEGFKHSNEYCIYEQKIISVLVKNILNHSKTHTFLVWSAKRFLENIPEIKNIKTHHTKDADLTFNLKGKVYALEIEIGSLLKKKKQLEEKVNYLNKKYPKRWMFIVSNKNIISKYRKYGLSTPRNRVAENLNKLLKIDTLKNWVETYY